MGSVDKLSGLAKVRQITSLRDDEHRSFCPGTAQYPCRKEVRES